MPLLPTIQRPRLISEISDPSLRVVKLIAPAGYGKTTLVNSYVSGEHRYARVDLERVSTNIQLHRRCISALAPFADASLRADLPERMLGLGEDEAGWGALTATLLEAAPSDLLVIFENAEYLRDDAILSSSVERLSLRAPDDARILVCSRANVLRLGRFAGPDRTRILSSRDLRLTGEEIRQIFSTLSITRPVLESIERFTQGWPIVVMMLFTLARRGRLRAYLTDQDDVSDLYGYLATEVFTTLDPIQMHVLEALTAVPDATERELGYLFPDTNIAQVVQSLQAETPFLVASGETIEAHPAMREMISARIDVDTYRARLYDLVPRGDGGVRAAQIALRRNRPLDAARALAESGMQGDMWTPGHAEILSELPESVFRDYPTLWGAAAYFRGSTDGPGAVLRSQQLLAEISDDAPADVRIDLMCTVILLQANTGYFGDAQELIGKFLTHPALIGNAKAAMFAAFFQKLIEFYRGDPVDVEQYLHDFAELFMLSTTQQCFRDVIVLACYYRSRGDYGLERSAVERGVGIARATKVPVVRAYAATYAAMSAWFWGDDGLFEFSLAELEACLAPSIANSFLHFIECARGRGHIAKEMSEKMDVRTYAYAIAAGLEKQSSQRIRLAQLALIAAQRSSQRFCEVIARLILAWCEPAQYENHVSRAVQLALEMQSHALHAALLAVKSGTAAGTMLHALEKRFKQRDEGAEGDALTVNLFDRAVLWKNERVAISPREFELLVYLAINQRPVEAAVIAGTIWPTASRERALLSLRVTLNRLRNRFGKSETVMATPTGFTLGVATVLLPRAVNRDRSRTSMDIAEDSAELSAWPPKYLTTWHWFEEIDRAVAAGIR